MNDAQRKEFLAADGKFQLTTSAMGFPRSKKDYAQFSAWITTLMVILFLGQWVGLSFGFAHLMNQLFQWSGGAYFITTIAALFASVFLGVAEEKFIHRHLGMLNFLPFFKTMRQKYEYRTQIMKQVLVDKSNCFSLLHYFELLIRYYPQDDHDKQKSRVEALEKFKIAIQKQEDLTQEFVRLYDIYESIIQENKNFASNTMNDYEIYKAGIRKNAQEILNQQKANMELQAQKEIEQEFGFSFDKPNKF